MKPYLIIFILLLFICISPASADYIATQTIVVNAQNTITIVISGTLNATIDGSTGNLSNALSINFNIATNEDLENVRLKALVLDDTSTKQSAFYGTSASEVSSKNIHLVLGNYNHLPSLTSINDCKQSSSTAINNSDTIAYPGTVTINNGGTLSYNPSNGYFSCAIKQNTSDLNLTLTTAPKSGTYDLATSMDEPDPYEVEIYLDNIP